jgi:aldehyde:ferredoxin oxidoreductase
LAAPVKTVCLYAGIINDLHRAAGRSGVGTVMGSKNLKAVAIRGTKGVSGIRDFPAFLAATTAAKKVLADNAVTGQGLPTYGTQVLMNVINEMGALPTRNHRDVQFEDAGKISAEAMHEKRPTDGKAHLVTNAACFGCTIACGRISKMDETHFSVKNSPKYWGASGGLEYEAAWALGAANGVGDLEALQYVNMLCNEHGMDPISFGTTVGAAMELFELGILSKEQIGLEAPFGSAEALCKLAEMTAAWRRLRQGSGVGERSHVRQVRSPGSVDERQESGIPGLRRSQHPGHRSGLCHLQPRGLPFARLHGGFRSARHSGQDRPAGD